MNKTEGNGGDNIDPGKRPRHKTERQEWYNGDHLIFAERWTRTEAAETFQKASPLARLSCFVSSIFRRALVHGKLYCNVCNSVERKITRPPIPKWFWRFAQSPRALCEKESFLRVWDNNEGKTSLSISSHRISSNQSDLTKSSPTI